MRQRLDQELVARGLAPTRSQARDLIKRGCVKVAGAVAGKSGIEVAADATVDVDEGAQPYVSRAGLKLAAALQSFGFDARGVTALDAGASTGGFTHVLLEAGARRVYAIDIGTRQLHSRLAADPRVISLEGRDVRLIDRRVIPEPIGAVVADLSFISLTQGLAPVLSLADRGAWLVALIKPQFEVGRADIGKRGIVRDEAARTRAVAKVRDWIGEQSAWRVTGVIGSPIVGGSGNSEFLIGARHVS